MRKFILLIVIFMTYSTLYTQSNDWKYMYDWKNNEGTFSKYYNLNSLKYEGNVISVWTKNIPQSPIKQKSENGEEKEIESKQYYMKYYCGERALSMILLKIVFIDGTNELKPFSYTDKLAIAPDTNGEEEYLFFCFK